MPIFHNHACRMMPILTKDAYPNYGMVTGGGGTMWDNQQTESFKKPRSVPLHLHLDRSDIVWCPAAPSASEICNSLKGHRFIRKQGSVLCIPCENIWNYHISPYQCGHFWRIPKKKNGALSEATGQKGVTSCDIIIYAQKWFCRKMH